MMRFNQSSYVAWSYLSSLACFQKGCVEIGTNPWKSSNASLAQRFHSTLASSLSVPETNLALFANGALAFKLAIPVLDIHEGEIINTSFTFAATAHTLVHSIGQNV